MKLNYIFFDLDGTITESGPGIMNSVKYALSKFDIKEDNEDQLRKFIGPPLVASFMKHYHFSKEDALKAVTYYREYYSTKGLYENSIYDGVPEMLDELSQAGYRLVIATSKPEKFTNLILKHFDLYDKFYLIAGASMDQSRTSKSDVIAYALDQLEDADPEAILMVGDRDNDILGAKDHKLKSMGVLYGYGSLEELNHAGADFIAKQPSDISGIILKGK